MLGARARAAAGGAALARPGGPSGRQRATTSSCGSTSASSAPGYGWSFPARRRGARRRRLVRPARPRQGARRCALAGDARPAARRLPGQLDPAPAARRRSRTASSSSATRPATACRSPPRASARRSTSGSPAGASCARCSRGGATRDGRRSTRYGAFSAAHRWKYESHAAGAARGPAAAPARARRAGARVRARPAASHWAFRHYLQHRAARRSRCPAPPAAAPRHAAVARARRCARGVRSNGDATASQLPVERAADVASRCRAGTQADEEPLEAVTSPGADVVEDDVGERRPRQEQEAEERDPALSIARLIMSEKIQVKISAMRGPIRAKRAIRQGMRGSLRAREHGCQPVERDVAAGDDHDERRRRRARPRPPAPPATAAAPAPSATIPCARARKRIASSISASDDLRDRGDVVAHELERDRAGLEVAGEAVGERLPHLDRRDRARRQRGGERRASASASTATTRASAAGPPPRARARRRALPPPSGQATVERPRQLRVELAPDRRLARDHAACRCRTET